MPGLDLRKTRVLAVDDNEQSLELLSQILMGFRVEQTVACRSAAQARTAAASTRFDLIVIDAEMPGEDGFSLIRDIRSQADGPNFTAPIIMVSGHTPHTKVTRARDAGANLVVKKPIAPATLLSRIAWLARSTRKFVMAPGYCGPDRRFKKGAAPGSVGERRADELAIAATPERALSQGDVDALFG